MTPTDPFEGVKQAWDWFLIHNVVARHYDGLNFLGPKHNNPMLDRSIISLLTVALASVLDESLETYSLHFGHPGKNDSLFARIEALKAANKVSNAAQLHDVRLARNEQAHEAGDPSVLSKPIDWTRLDQRIAEVAKALRELGMLAAPQKYEYFAERIPVEPPNDGAVLSFKYRSGVKRDGKEAFVYEFIVNHHGVGGSVPGD